MSAMHLLTNGGEGNGSAWIPSFATDCFYQCLKMKLETISQGRTFSTLNSNEVSSLLQCHRGYVQSRGNDSFYVGTLRAACALTHEWKLRKVLEATAIECEFYIFERITCCSLSSRQTARRETCIDCSYF